MELWQQYIRWLQSRPEAEREHLLKMEPAKRLKYFEMFVKRRPGEEIVLSDKPPPSTRAVSPEARERAFLEQLRQFFDGLEDPLYSWLRNMPPDVQEWRLRELFFRRLQMTRTHLFHHVLSDKERQEVLALASKDPMAAERRLRQLWRQHGRPGPPPDRSGRPEDGDGRRSPAAP